MQTYVFLIIFTLLKWLALAEISNEQCAFDPWEGGEPTNPAAKFRLLPSGIDYFLDEFFTKDITQSVLSMEIPNFPISNFMYLYDLRVLGFKASWVKNFVQPNTLRWGFDQGEVIVAGSVRRFVSGMRRPLLDSIVLTFESVSLETLTAVIKNPDGRPAVQITSCKVQLGSVKATVNGQSRLLAELFRRTVMKQVQDTLHQVVCGRINSINFDFDKVLSNFPLRSKIAENNMHLDYALINDPQVVDDDQGFEGLLTSYINYRDTPSYPFYPPAIAESANNQFMSGFYITDYVFNTFMYTAFKEGMLNIEAIPKTMTTGGARYLRLSCPVSSVCVGNIFRTASSVGGRGAIVKASIDFVNSPKATFDQDRAYWTGQTVLKLEVLDNLNRTTKLFNASSDCMYGQLVPVLYDNKLYTSVTVDSMSFSSVDSPTKVDLDSNDVEKLQSIFTAVFNDMVGRFFYFGLPLPLPEGISMVDSSPVQILPRTLFIDSNLAYSKQQPSEGDV